MKPGVYMSITGHLILVEKIGCQYDWWVVSFSQHQRNCGGYVFDRDELKELLSAYEYLGEL